MLALLMSEPCNIRNQPVGFHKQVWRAEDTKWWLFVARDYPLITIQM